MRPSIFIHIFVLSCSATKRTREDEDETCGNKVRAVSNNDSSVQNIIDDTDQPVAVSVLLSSDPDINNNIEIMEENETANGENDGMPDEGLSSLHHTLMEIQKVNKDDPKYLKKARVVISSFIFSSEPSNSGVPLEWEMERIDPFDLAQRVSMLYDAFVENNMSECLSLIFDVAMVHEEDGGIKMDRQFWELFAQSLKAVNFEGWAELMGSLISEQMVKVFSVLIYHIPESERLRRIIFNSFCLDARTLEDCNVIAMLYHFIKARGISISQDVNRFVHSNVGSDELEDRLSTDLLPIFSMIPSDQWALDEVMTMFAQEGILTTIFKYGEKFIAYLESVSLWEDAMRIRLILISIYFEVVHDNWATEENSSLNISHKADELILEEESVSLKLRYQRLFRAIEEHPALANRAISLIAEGYHLDTIIPILSALPSMFYDLLIAIVEKYQKPSESLNIMSDFLESENMQLDLGYQNGRIVKSALQKNIFNLFLVTFQPFIMPPSTEVSDIIVDHCKQYILTPIADQDIKKDVFSALAFLVVLDPSRAKEVLLFALENEFPLLIEIVAKMRINILNDNVFPLEEVSRAAIMRGDEMWCLKLTFSREGKEILETTAAILMSEGFEIPLQISQYLN